MWHFLLRLGFASPLLTDSPFNNLSTATQQRFQKLQDLERSFGAYIASLDSVALCSEKMSGKLVALTDILSGGLPGPHQNAILTKTTENAQKLHDGAVLFHVHMSRLVGSVTMIISENGVEVVEMGSEGSAGGGDATAAKTVANDDNFLSTSRSIKHLEVAVLSPIRYFLSVTQNTINDHIQARYECLVALELCKRAVDVSITRDGTTEALVNDEISSIDIDAYKGISSESDLLALQTALNNYNQKNTVACDAMLQFDSDVTEFLCGPFQHAINWQFGHFESLHNSFNKSCSSDTCQLKKVGAVTIPSISLSSPNPLNQKSLLKFDEYLPSPSTFTQPPPILLLPHWSDDSSIMTKNANYLSIPKVIYDCVLFLMTRKAYEVEGIFRVSGLSSSVKDIMLKYKESCVAPKAGNELSQWESLISEDCDIHIATGILKMFFRDLAEPLFTFELHSQFINAVKSQDKTDETENNILLLMRLRKLIDKLPRPNALTARLIFALFNLVSENQSTSKMPALNIATILSMGGGLLKSENEISDPHLSLELAPLHNKIITMMITNHKDVFNQQ